MSKKKVNLKKSQSIGTKYRAKICANSVENNTEKKNKGPLKSDAQIFRVTRSKAEAVIIRSEVDEKKTKEEKPVPLSDELTTRLKSRKNENKKLNIPNQTVNKIRNYQVRSSDMKDEKYSEKEIFDKNIMIPGPSYVRYTRSQAKSKVEKDYQKMDPNSSQISSKCNLTSEEKSRRSQKIVPQRAVIANQITFEENEIVFPKMTGYEPWPSRILKISPQKARVEVYFYGDGRTGTVFKSQLTKFTDYINPLKTYNIPAKKINLTKGIKEALIEFGRRHPTESMKY